MGSNTVVYDADCGICAWSADWITRHVPAVTVVSHTDYGVDELGSVWLVREPEMLEGADAVARVLTMADDRWCRVLGRMMMLPVVVVVARAVYRLIARNRRRLSRLFGLTACAVTPARRIGD